MNSKQKGARGERELAKVLREYGFEAERTQQYCGNTEESADLRGLPYIHIECKRVEKLNIDDAMEQASDDMIAAFHNEGEEHKLPAVFHRRNGKKWKVTMYIDEWMMLYKEYFAGKKIGEREANVVKSI